MSLHSSWNQILNFVMIYIAFLLIPTVTCSGVVKQKFVSSSRIDLLLGYLVLNNNGTFTRTHSTNISLLPNVAYPTLFPLPTYGSTFHYEFTMLDAVTGKEINSKIHRGFTVEQQTNWNSATFIANGTSLLIETKYECSNDFFGPHCDQKCNLDQVRDERKRCTKIGVQCNYGWMGTQCGEVVDPRKCGCHNEGVCVSSLTFNPSELLSKSERLICECQSGFKGEKCEVAEVSGMIANKSRACDSPNACLNGGQCFTNGPKLFCSCPTGFLGHSCEYKSSTDVSVNNSSVASTFSTIYILSSICIIIIGLAACFKYKIQPRREQALARRQLPPPFPQPIQNKSMLVNKKVASKVYKIENGIDSHGFVGNEEIYERYSAAPVFRLSNPIATIENEYAVISRTGFVPPPPPSHLPPPTPILP